MKKRGEVEGGVSILLLGRCLENEVEGEMRKGVEMTGKIQKNKINGKASG